MVIPSFGINGYSAKNHSFLKVGTVFDLSIFSFSRKHIFIPIPGGGNPLNNDLWEQHSFLYHLIVKILQLNMLKMIEKEALFSTCCGNSSQQLWEQASRARRCLPADALKRCAVQTSPGYVREELCFQAYGALKTGVF